MSDSTTRDGAEMVVRSIWVPLIHERLPRHFNDALRACAELARCSRDDNAKSLKLMATIVTSTREIDRIQGRAKAALEWTPAVVEFVHSLNRCLVRHASAPDDLRHVFGVHDVWFVTYYGVDRCLKILREDLHRICPSVLVLEGIESLIQYAENPTTESEQNVGRMLGRLKDNVAAVLRNSVGVEARTQERADDAVANANSSIELYIEYPQCVGWLELAGTHLKWLHEVLVGALQTGSPHEPHLLDESRARKLLLERAATTCRSHNVASALHEWATWPHTIPSLTPRTPRRYEVYNWITTRFMREARVCEKGGAMGRGGGRAKVCCYRRDALKRLQREANKEDQSAGKDT